MICEQKSMTIQSYVLDWTQWLKFMANVFLGSSQGCENDPKWHHL